MGNNKKTDAGDVLRQFGAFLLKLVLKAIALVLWAIFKLISGISSAITSLLENYLDI